MWEFEPSPLGIKIRRQHSFKQKQSLISPFCVWSCSDDNFLPVPACTKSWSSLRQLKKLAQVKGTKLSKHHTWASVVRTSYNRYAYGLWHSCQRRWFVRWSWAECNPTDIKNTNLCLDTWSASYITWWQAVATEHILKRNCGQSQFLHKYGCIMHTSVRLHFMF